MVNYGIVQHRSKSFSSIPIRLQSGLVQTQVAWRSGCIPIQIQLPTLTKAYLYAAFAFHNCSYGVQELKSKHAFRKIEIIHAWQFVSSVAQKGNFVDAIVIDWSNIDNTLNELKI